MPNPQYVFLIVILAALIVYYTLQACNRQCGKYFADCIRYCCLEDDQENLQRNSIPMNNLSPRHTPQVPSIVINRPNPNERESPPMYSISRKMLPSSNQLQALGRKTLASIPKGKGKNKSSKANVSDAVVKFEPSSINMKNSLRSEFHVDLNNNYLVDGVGNRKDGKINQGKQSRERNIVTTVAQKEDPKPKVLQESQNKKNETPCTLKGTSNEYWKTSATGNPLNLGNNKSSEHNEEPYYQNISFDSIARETTRYEVNRMQATSQGKLKNRRIRGDSPIPNVKRRITNEKRKQHLSRYIVQNDIGENLWPNYKTAKPFVSCNNQEQLLQKRSLGDCYQGPILKGISKKGFLKLKSLPEHEVVNFSEDVVEKDEEIFESEEVVNPSVPHGGVMNNQTKASVSNLNRGRSITSKRETAAGGTEENLQLKLIKNDRNSSKLQGNEETVNPSVLCGGGWCCKTKAPLLNLNQGRSIISERKIAVGGAEDGQLLKLIKNDRNPRKSKGNEETINPSVLCGGGWCCETKAPLWKLKGERSITRKGEIATRGTKDGLRFIIMNDTNPSKPLGNEMVKGMAMKLPSVQLKRKQCTGIMTENTYSGRDIGSEFAKDDCSSKINCYDINSSMLQNKEMVKGTTLKLPCVPLKRKQFIGNNKETEFSRRVIVPKYTNDIYRSNNKCYFIKNEMGFFRIPVEEKKDNISQRFPEKTRLRVTRKSCKLHASDKKPYLIPNKYLRNKVLSNNFNVSEHASPSDLKFNLHSKKSSKELSNRMMKAKSLGNEQFGIDQMMKPGFMNVGNIHLSKPSDRSKNSNLSSSFAEDKEIGPL